MTRRIELWKDTYKLPWTRSYFNSHTKRFVTCNTKIAIQIQDFGADGITVLNFPLIYRIILSTVFRIKNFSNQTLGNGDLSFRRMFVFSHHTLKDRVETNQSYLTIFFGNLRSFGFSI